jgi:hypothetical protein
MAAFSRTMNTTRVSRLSPPYTHTDAGVGGVRRVQVCVCGCVSVRAREWHTLADLTIYIQHAQQQRFETRLVNIHIIDVSSICMPQVWIHPCTRVSRWNGDIHQCRTARNISRQHYYHGPPTFYGKKYKSKAKFKRFHTWTIVVFDMSLNKQLDV